MPVSALVVTAITPSAVAVLVERLRSDPRLTLGAPCGPSGDRLPMAAATGTSSEGEALVEALIALPEVGHVDVVMIDFSDEREAEGAATLADAADDGEPFR